jgi:tetratricopeptide (TPR) repeat protein
MAGKPDIEKAVLEQKQEQVFSEWYYNLKMKAKVEIEDPSLLALDLRFKGRLEDAIVQYQKAIRANPGNAYLRIFLATLYEDMKRQPLALSEYKDAVQVSSGDPILYLLYGQALYKADQKEQALEQFKKASLIAGDRKPLHEELLKTYTEMGIKSMIQVERDEIHRLEKKELFEKSLSAPVPGTTGKVKTD